MHYLKLIIKFLCYRCFTTALRSVFLHSFIFFPISFIIFSFSHAELGSNNQQVSDALAKWLFSWPSLVMNVDKVFDQGAIMNKLDPYPNVHPSCCHGVAHTVFQAVILYLSLQPRETGQMPPLQPQSTNATLIRDHLQYYWLGIISILYLFQVLPIFYHSWVPHVNQNKCQISEQDSFQLWVQNC